MAIRTIQTGLNNKILRAKSKEVTKVDSSIRKVIRDMKDTLHLDGIGIAAPQIGENLRMILVLTNPQTKKEKTILMVNPIITYFSEDTEIAEEGCLSLPNYFADVERSREIIVQFKDEKLKIKIMRLNTLNARIVQHELDHLDGVLFADKVVK